MMRSRPQSVPSASSRFPSPNDVCGVDAPQRANLTELLVAALADVAYGAPSRLPSVKAACVTALSAALHRLHARCTTGLPGIDSIPPQKRENASAAAAAVYPGAAATSSAAASEATAVCASTGLPSPSICREARTRKLARAVGAAAFLAKPREGLKLLQLEGVLGQQLDAAEVAEFLRSTPGLDKAAVGAYLGEAGAKRGNGGDGSGNGNTRTKSTDRGGTNVVGCSTSASEDGALAGIAGSGPRGATGSVGGRDGRAAEAAAEAGEAAVTGGGREGGGRGGVCVYQGDTAEFHAEVLEAFVETFDFRDQGILASLRMFLEAFRLPGEAQQIDRILHVRGCCVFRGAVHWVLLAVVELVPCSGFHLSMHESCGVLFVLRIVVVKLFRRQSTSASKLQLFCF